MVVILFTVAIPVLGLYEIMVSHALCPTNALEKIPVDKEVIFNRMKMGQPLNMGIPILDRRICYPWIGVNACGLCWEICPYTYKGAIVAGDARAFHPADAPNFYPEKCVGCGLCVDVCPLPQKERAIKIVPAQNPKSRYGEWQNCRERSISGGIDGPICFSISGFGSYLARWRGV